MMLEIRDVRKQFDSLKVLDGISFGVEKSDVFAILGPSGSGKTTLLRCLNFLEKADFGTMVFDGKRIDLSKASKAEIAEIRKKTAFVFQSYNLFLNKTVLDNVTLGLTAGAGMKRKDAVEIATRMLEKVGMADKLSSYPSQLSGGQQQRVAPRDELREKCLKQGPFPGGRPHSGVRSLQGVLRKSQRGAHKGIPALNRVRSGREILSDDC